MMTHAGIRFCGIILWLACQCAWPQETGVSRFHDQGLTGWQEKSFRGHTRYRMVNESGRRVVMADADHSASGLVKKIQVDLRATPYLNWRWKIGRFPASVDERKKSGDDYAARIYVIISGGVRFWKTRAVNYVWAAKTPRDRSWKNPFSANAVMISQNPGHNRIGQWVTEKRNILQDIHLHLGEQLYRIDAVAIMTDADNTGSQARAWYGEIYFSEN